MSRTDKTRPYWVQMLDSDNRGWKAEHHDHRTRSCDIHIAYKTMRNRRNTWWFIGQRTCCTLWPSTIAAHSGIYARSSAVVKMYRAKDLGKVRGRERAMIRELLKTSREDMIDYDYMPSQHRHNALWEAY